MLNGLFGQSHFFFSLKIQLKENENNRSKYSTDYDELLVEQKGRAIWIHFAVRPWGNRIRSNFKL